MFQVLFYFLSKFICYSHLQWHDLFCFFFFGFTNVYSQAKCTVREPQRRQGSVNTIIAQWSPETTTQQQWRWRPRSSPRTTVGKEVAKAGAASRCVRHVFSLIFLSFSPFFKLQLILSFSNKPWWQRLMVVWRNKRTGAHMLVCMFSFFLFFGFANVIYNYATLGTTREPR